MIELLGPDKQLGFTVGSDGSTCYLRAFTHLQTKLTAGSNSLAANPNQHSLQFSPDALTSAQFSDVAGSYDQVICRGARRKTICTLEYGQQLVKAWDVSAETEYGTAASGETGYAALDEDDKKARNASFRGRDKLKPVYRTFKLDPDWDYQIGGEDVFPDNEHPRSVEFVQRLPIKAGIEWHDAVEESDFERRDEGRPPLVTWEDPTVATNRVDNASIEQLQEVINPPPDYDFTVRPAVSGRQLQLHVDGGPQHAIASETFTALPVDSDGVLDYETVKATVCLQEDRHCEGVYPETPATADVVRRLLVDMGDTYERIQIHADTVTEVFWDFAGSSEQTSDGGVLVDDSPKLASLAEIIAGSVLPSRKTISWQSLRKLSSIAVGDLITTADSATVIAPITSIHLRAQVGINRPARAVQQSFEVYRGASDPLNILRQLGGIRPGSELPKVQQRKTALQLRGERVRALKNR